MTGVQLDAGVSMSGPWLNAKRSNVGLPNFKISVFESLQFLSYSHPFLLGMDSSKKV